MKDPNRRIADWVYWNGEETVTPDKILEHLTILMDELVKKLDDENEG